MSRPIPVDVVPSHVHLSENHQRILFGERHDGTIFQAISQTGQFAYEESVEVIGSAGRRLKLRVLGPSRKVTQIELTSTEAMFLGIDAPVAKSGDLAFAGSCRLETTYGGVDVPAGVIIPLTHLHLSDSEAKEARLTTGSIVRVDIIGDTPHMIDNVVVRVHPTYRARLHINADVARDLWMHTGAHVRIRDLQS